MSSSIHKVKLKPKELRARAERFAEDLTKDDELSASPNRRAKKKNGSSSSPTSRLKGKNSQLEKGYLRLTEEADASKVRPVNILRKALEMVKERYQEDDNYVFACDQLKSIRQDLMVQNINTKFTSHVLEVHARIALEQGDLDEYNACQCRLQEMRREGVGISVDEFMCYRLLYSLHVGSSLEMAAALQEVENDKRNDPTADDSKTKFAIDVILSLRSFNMFRFLKLYGKSPAQSGYLMDHLLFKMRLQAFENIVKTYLSLPVNICMEFLGYREEEMEEAISYFRKHSGVIITSSGEGEGSCQVGENALDCTATRAAISKNTKAMLADQAREAKLARKREKKRKREQTRGQHSASASSSESCTPSTGILARLGNSGSVASSSATEAKKRPRSDSGGIVDRLGLSEDVGEGTSDGSLATVIVKQKRRKKDATGTK